MSNWHCDDCGLKYRKRWFQSDNTATKKWNKLHLMFHDAALTFWVQMSELEGAEIPDYIRDEMARNNE